MGRSRLAERHRAATLFRALNPKEGLTLGRWVAGLGQTGFFFCSNFSFLFLPIFPSPCSSSVDSRHGENGKKYEGKAGPNGANGGQKGKDRKKVDRKKREKQREKNKKKGGGEKKSYRAATKTGMKRGGYLFGAAASSSSAPGGLPLKTEIEKNEYAHLNIDSGSGEIGGGERQAPSVETCISTSS